MRMDGRTALQLYIPKTKQPGCKKGATKESRINLTLTRLVTTRIDISVRLRSSHISIIQTFGWIHYKLITKIICKFKLIVVWPLFVCTSVYTKTKSGQTTINLDFHITLVINL